MVGPHGLQAAGSPASDPVSTVSSLLWPIARAHRMWPTERDQVLAKDNAGANYAGTPPNITPRGQDQYQIDVTVGLELSSMQRSTRPAEDRYRPWDRFPPDART